MLNRTVIVYGWRCVTVGYVCVLYSFLWYEAWPFGRLYLIYAFAATIMEIIFLKIFLARKNNTPPYQSCAPFTKVHFLRQATLRQMALKCVAETAQCYINDVLLGCGLRLGVAKLRCEAIPTKYICYTSVPFAFPITRAFCALSSRLRRRFDIVSYRCRSSDRLVVKSNFSCKMRLFRLSPYAPCIERHTNQTKLWKGKIVYKSNE